MEITLYLVLGAMVGFYLGVSTERAMWRESVSLTLEGEPSLKESRLLADRCPPGFERMAIATTPEVMAFIRSQGFNKIVAESLRSEAI